MSKRPFLLLCFVGCASILHALEPADWQYRQEVTVERAGIVKLALPPTTLNSAGPNGAQLRLIDPMGVETPYVWQESAPIAAAPSSRPRAVRTELVEGATRVLIEPSTSNALSAVILATPAPLFLKGVRVETSTDDVHWKAIRSGAVIFRQYGAEQLALELPGESVSQVRLTLDDSQSRPIPITGVSLVPIFHHDAAPEVPVPDARISRREEFAGETVLTIDLGAQNLPIASIDLIASDAVFMRRVTALVRELRDDTAVERPISSATVCRVAIDGMAPTEKYSVPISTGIGSRELTLRIENGDSPPLTITRITVRQRPVWLAFPVSSPGVHQLLTGSPTATAPHYDLVSLADQLRQLPASPLALGPKTENPSFRARPALSLPPPAGGAIDPSPWRFCKEVRLREAGVQELELDLATLAGSSALRSDLRLVRQGTQVPYLIEETHRARAIELPFTPSTDAKRPQLSRWRLRLPHIGAPITRVTVTSSTALFERTVLLTETIEADRNGASVRTLASARWSHAPGLSSNLTLTLPERSQSDSLLLEIDNGDNPPIALTKVEAAYPVVRLLFHSEVAPLSLYYGNPEAFAPRYDLALMAKQLIAAERSPATLGAEQHAKGSASLMSGTRAGVIFWAALGLVVIGLLILVSKLLPKPAA